MKHVKYIKNTARLHMFANKITRIALASLCVLALGGIGIWTTYRDKTTAPRLSIETFQNKGLQHAVKVIADATVDGGAPGAVILIRKNNQEFVAAAGLANKRTGQAMPIDEALRIGSVSKVYTAVVILSLVNDNMLSLDDRISNYLPNDVTDGLQNAHQATVRELLNHTAGIPDYYDIRSYFGQDWTQAIDLERTLPVAKRGKSDFSAGEKFEYSNMGYILLGEIAEKVSGQALGDLIKHYISVPLSFSNTHYNLKHPNENSIHGYGTLLRPWADTYDWWEHSGPDGGIIASASETARFIESLSLENGKFKNLGAKMLDTVIDGDGRRESQGLGLNTITLNDGTELIGHSGDVFGYQTVAYAWPEQNAAFVAHLNCDCSALTVSMLRSAYYAIKADGSKSKLISSTLP